MPLLYLPDRREFFLWGDDCTTRGLDSLASLADYDTLREPVPGLHLSFEIPPISGALLTQLGTPAAWSRDTSPVEMLAPILRAAADEARRLALAEPVMVEEAAADNRKPARRRARAKARAAKQSTTEKASPAAGSRETPASRKASESAARSTARRKKAP